MKTISSLLILFSLWGYLIAQPDSESDDFSYPLKLYNQEFYDLAAQQFIKFYNNHPNSAKVDEAKYYAGMSYLKLKEFSLARIEFQSLALEHPKSKRAAEAWLRAAECYLKLANLKEAAKAFETIRLLYPEDILAAEGLFKAGVLHLEMKNFEKANQNFNVIMERYTGSKYYFPAMVKAGLSLFSQDEIEKSKNLLLKALEGQTDGETQAEAYFALAKIQANQGYLEEAKERYNVLIKNYTSSPYQMEAILNLSGIYINENKLDLALSFLTRGISQAQDSHIIQQFHHLLGDVHYLKSNFALAENEYSLVHITNNDSLRLIIELKRALAQKRQNFISRAAKNLAGVLQNYPHKQSLLFRVINNIQLDWLEIAGENQLAISHLYEQIHVINSLGERIPLTLRLVRILNKLGLWRDIIRELQPFLLLQDKYPEKDDILFHLATAYEKIGEYEESAYYYDQLINEFSASEYYSEASERLIFLKDYKIFDKDIAVTRLASLIGRIVNQKDYSKLQFDLGKIYFSDLKDYSSAEQQFKQALDGNAVNLGDQHLYLGKTYLKLAAQNPNSAGIAIDYLEKALENFKKAVENTQSCSAPDEASWLMVETSVSIDSLPLTQEKKYIETLIHKYPQSKYLEQWYEGLAHALAFDPGYAQESIKYFQILIDQYKKSDRYPSYLFQCAQLIQETSPQQALDYYKEIAADYPFAHESALALNQVAGYYEQEQKYAEANTLFKKLNNYYYYSNVADEARVKLGEIYQKAGQYDDAISVLLQQINSPFITDQVLSRQFLNENLYKNIYLLARAYMLKGDRKRSLEYYKLYLSIATFDANREQAKFDCGEIYKSTNQKNIALDYFRAVTDNDSVLYSRSRLYIAQIYFEQANYKDAAQIYNEILKRFKGRPEENEVYGRYIISLLRDGNITDSKPHIEIYRKKFPNEKNYPAQFILELGSYHRLTKQFDKALKYFEEVKKKYNTSEYVDDADYYSALTLITLNKIEDAYKILTSFYATYPKSNRLAEALNTLGSLYFRSEKYDSAITMFKNALKICYDPELEANIMSNLIRTYTQTAFWDAAQALAREYTDKFSYKEDQIDKKIIIAQAYINLNQFQNAVEYLRKIKLEADSEREPEIQFYIGEALLKAGQYEDAIAELVKIPLMSKKTKLQWEASALYYSGQSYEKLGRLSDAIRMYEEIIRRPGIEAILKKEAQKRIEQLQ